MKVNELRIGNILYYHDKTQIVAGIVGNTIYYQNAECFDSNISNYKPWNPIPLTTNWLKKFNFTHDGITYNKGWIEIWYSNYAKSFTLRLYKTGEVMERMILIEYVHQLQNLYFTLTGTELTEINK